MKSIFLLLLATLLFSVLDLYPQEVKSSAVDLALVNGRIWTASEGWGIVEALSIQGNRILHAGTTAEIRKDVGAQTRVIDLGGRLVIPGFNDAHIHFLSGALGLAELELFDAKSASDVVERIAAFAKKNPKSPWITGRGWQYNYFPGGLPTKSYLDAVVKDRPVFLASYDGHSGWANSRALELAGIRRETRFEGFGEIVRNDAGEATGVLKEGAQRLVRALIPEPTRERKLAALRDGMKMAARLGITSIQNAHGSPEEFAIWDELLKQNELTMRVSMAFSVGASTTPVQIARLAELKNQYDLNPMLRASSVKIMLDGVIDSHTAAMIDRYSDLPPNHGAPFGELSMPPNDYRNLVIKLDQARFQIYTHAIGDRAVREALNGYEAARKANGERNARHRIEHIETIAREDLPRFASLGVLAAMQPIHADPGTIDVWSQAIGPVRLPLSFPWAALLKNQARLVYGSDWPAAISVSPAHGLHVAINRRTPEGQPPKGWIPEQRLAVVDALRAYTQMGAYSTFEESLKGRLVPGMLGDLIVLSHDLFKIDPMKIHQTRVLMTLFDGKVIYTEEGIF
jgi:hypothetical protein